MLIYLTSFAAGTLAALSPCVLPVLPIMAGSATTENKRGPVYLAAGLVISFVGMSMAFSSMNSFLGLSEEFIRKLSAALLLASGLILLIPFLRKGLSLFLQPLAEFAFKRSHTLNSRSAGGQFGIGVLLGAAWGPCIGPALGIAMGLAASKDGTFPATVMMAFFGVGLTVPFLAIAYGFRRITLTQRTRLQGLNRIGGQVFGASAALAGFLMLTGVDKKLEALLISSAPEWILKISATL